MRLNELQPGDLDPNDPRWRELRERSKDVLGCPVTERLNGRIVTWYPVVIQNEDYNYVEELTEMLKLTTVPNGLDQFGKTRVYVRLVRVTDAGELLLIFSSVQLSQSEAAELWRVWDESIARAHGLEE